MELAIPLPLVPPTPARAVSVASPAGAIPALFCAPDDAPWKSSVVVVVGATGLDDHARAACERLAAEGHGALAIDLKLTSQDPSRTGPRGMLSPAALTRSTDGVAAALAHLRGVAPAPAQRVGVVGFAAGGLVALAAGYRCQVGAAVSFYGEGPMQLRANLAQIIEKPKRQAAPFLCLLGGEDADVKPEDLGAIRERLDGFGMKHTFIVYPRTKTDFCTEGGPRYRRSEAEDAWRRVMHALETAPKLRHRFRPREPGSVR